MLRAEYPLKDISFSIKRDTILWIYYNDKVIIKQHAIWDLPLEKEIWTSEKMKEVEAKVKEIKQELNIPQKKYY